MIAPIGDVQRETIVTRRIVVHVTKKLGRGHDGFRDFHGLDRGHRMFERGARGHAAPVSNHEHTARRGVKKKRNVR